MTAEAADAIGTVEAFDTLLRAEATAARVADAERLLVLQIEKQRLMRDLEASSTPPIELERLAARARANLPLLRELVALHRALLESSAKPTYGQQGAISVAPPSARVHRSG